MLEAAAGYAQMPAPVLGQVLLGLECADAAGTAARDRALNAFDARDGHSPGRSGRRRTRSW
jgi:hypothetical protein